MTSPTMPPTPMTPHNYPIGHHRHSSMTRIGRKWLINMFFQHQPPQPPIPHTNTPQRPTNVFQLSYVINHGSPHPQDPTQLPYRSPQLLIRDQKWPKIVQKHVFFTYAFTRSHSTHECPYGQTNGVQCSHNTTQSGPLLHDPTHIPY
jgi:hypothetical protein